MTEYFGAPLVWHPGVPEDVDNINFIVYSADEPYRSLFTDNVNKVKISKTDGGSYYADKMLGWTDYSYAYNEYLPSTTVGFGEVIDYMANK